MEGLSNISVIKEVMARHNFHFSKTLGQNFLINPSVCPRIAEEGIANEGDGVLEIGTGFGVLTNELCKRAGKVVAIEIDDRLLPVLQETMAEHQNFEVVHGDVMKLDVKEILTEKFGDNPVHVCANLPYYITSPILMMLLEERLAVDTITVMVQAEAADRLCADVGSRACGAVTFAVHYYSTPKKLFSVSRGSFMPAPNVDSAVIQLTVKQNPDYGVQDERFLFALVKAAFSQRRKTLANPVSGALGIAKQQLFEAMDEIGLKRTARAEEVQFEQFIALANALVERKSTP